MSALGVAAGSRAASHSRPVGQSWVRPSSRTRPPRFSSRKGGRQNGTRTTTCSSPARIITMLDRADSRLEQALDPVDYAVISQGLIASAREMGVKLIRSAYSTIIREAADA